MTSSPLGENLIGGIATIPSGWRRGRNSSRPRWSATSRCSASMSSLASGAPVSTGSTQCEPRPGSSIGSAPASRRRASGKPMPSSSDPRRRGQGSSHPDESRRRSQAPQAASSRASGGGEPRGGKGGMVGWWSRSRVGICREVCVIIPNCHNVECHRVGMSTIDPADELR